MTLMTFLLLAATSFMLFFNAAEYAVSAREHDRTMGYYRGIAAVDDEPQPEGYPDHDYYLYADERVENNPYGEHIDAHRYKGLRKADIDAISALPYVTATSTRYMTAGLSDTLLRADITRNHYNYTARFIAEGEFVSYMPDPLDAVWMFCDADPNGTMYYMNLVKQKTFNIAIDNLRVLAGDTSWLSYYQQGTGVKFSEGIFLSRITAYAYTGVTDYLDEYTDDRQKYNVIGNGSISGMFDIRHTSYIHTSDREHVEAYNAEFLESLEPGARYLIIGRFEPNIAKGGNPTLTDPATTRWWSQVYPLDGLPENYLELDEFAPLREMIEITEADRHTLDVVYTGDMSSIVRIAEGNMAMTDGRMITDEDSVSGNKVCIVNHAFAAQNRLKIGDTVSLRLGNKLFEQNAAIGAVASVPERYADNFTDEVEFEIVGTWRDIDTARHRDNDLFWGYSVNTVFVPASFLPVEVPDSHVFKPGEVSFVVGDARDIPTFLEKAAPMIEGELGLTLFFNDGGWLAMERQLSQAGTLAVVRLLLLSVSVLVAIGLTAYLFIARKRKEYAIMRALGSTRRMSARGLCVPFGLVAVLALVAGNALAYAFAGSAVDGALELYKELGFDADASIPALAFIVCALCEFAAMASVMAFGLRRLAKRPVLELLQVGVNRGVAKMSGATPSAAVYESRRALPKSRRISAEDSSLDASASVSKTGKNSAFGFVLRYVSRHMRRATVKSLLSVGLALLLLGSIGHFIVIRGIYSGLYESVEVKATFINCLSVVSGAEVDASDYVRSPYFETNIGELFDCNNVPVRVIMTNDLARYSDDAFDIEYLEGHDGESFSAISASENNTCILGGNFMNENGLSLGDTVMLSPLGQRAEYEEYHLRGVEDEKERQNIVDIINESLEIESTFFTVVGRVSTKDPTDTATNQPTMYVPVGSVFNREIYPLLDKPAIFELVEYTLAAPGVADDFRDYARERIADTIGRIGVSSSAFVMDTSEADNIQRISNLLSALFPIATAIAILLSGLIPGYSTMQSGRDAAIMRSLGTTKKRARALLTLEQTFLCLLGLLCACALLFTINGSSLVAHILPIGLYTTVQLTACVAGALSGAIVVTHRKALELLQVRE